VPNLDFSQKNPDFLKKIKKTKKKEQNNVTILDKISIVTLQSTSRSNYMDNLDNYEREIYSIWNNVLEEYSNGLMIYRRRLEALMTFRAILKDITQKGGFCDEIELHYLGVIDMKTGRIYYAERLTVFEGKNYDRLNEIIQNEKGNI
jgi:hypothetical protein